MNKLNHLTSLLDKLKHIPTKTLQMSLADVHHKGLFSLVIAGTKPGKLTRVFIADKTVKPYAVQLHTHRYPIKLTSIKGEISHHIADKFLKVDHTTVQLSEFEYLSPLNGGSGLKYLQESNIVVNDYKLPIGATIVMNTKEFHTVSCKKGAIWVVEEQGFETKSSRVLGVPFITEDLYNVPKQYQINDNCQLVIAELKSLVNEYKRTI